MNDTTLTQLKKYFFFGKEFEILIFTINIYGLKIFIKHVVNLLLHYL